MLLDSKRTTPYGRGQSGLDNKADGILVFLFGTLFIAAGAIAALYTVAGEFLNQVLNSEFLGYIIGTIISVILIVIGVVLLIVAIVVLGSRRD